ncbi:universal stress protein [Streptomyces sp. NPDC127063]|jgi:nucleotide-binding universal stress UspA family protein|uniref:universal stress protein n=1 Tax=Streptomyces sp. NPDC127063 TaxID=3347123 RepID=UPI00365CC950
MTQSTSHAPIVVGTDGSGASEPAMRFALHEAQLRSTSVRAVCAYDFTVSRATMSGWLTVPDSYDLDTQIRDATYESIARTVEEARQELGGPPIEVEIKVEPGRPAQVLLEASADACLLVVGSRGSGAWGRLTLGSTSTEVVHHAHLPVVVVPSRTQAEPT